MTPRAFFNVVHALAVEGASAVDRDRVTAVLARPLDAPDPVDDEGPVAVPAWMTQLVIPG